MDTSIIMLIAGAVLLLVAVFLLSRVGIRDNQRRKEDIGALNPWVDDSEHISSSPQKSAVALPTRTPADPAIGADGKRGEKAGEQSTDKSKKGNTKNSNPVSEAAARVAASRDRKTPQRSSQSQKAQKTAASKQGKQSKQSKQINQTDQAPRSPQDADQGTDAPSSSEISKKQGDAKSLAVQGSTHKSAALKTDSSKTDSRGISSRGISSDRETDTRKELPGKEPGKGNNASAEEYSAENYSTESGSFGLADNLDRESLSEDSTSTSFYEGSSYAEEPAGKEDANPFPGAYPDPQATAAEDGRVRPITYVAEDIRPFNGSRKIRRQWALDEGFEYAKEDDYILADWPVLLFGKATESAGGEFPQTTVKDLVSGFYRGHEVHIGDLGDYLLLAMRRGAESDVEILLTQGNSIPAGVHACGFLGDAEQENSYFAYSTHPRAWEWMNDERIENSQLILSHVVTDIALAHDWLVVRLAPQLSSTLWFDVFAALLPIVHASRVLPPRVRNLPLDMDMADPLSPHQIGEVYLDTHIPPGFEEKNPSGLVALPSSGEEKDEDKGESAPSHLKVVPDSFESSEFESTDSPYEDFFEQKPKKRTKPDIIRPENPIDLPRRDRQEILGNINDENWDNWQEWVPGSDTETEIPSLGEDPQHKVAFSNTPRVVRKENHDSTLFDSSSFPTSFSEPSSEFSSSDSSALSSLREDRTQGEEESGDTQGEGTGRKTRSSRHGIDESNPADTASFTIAAIVERLGNETPRSKHSRSTEE